MFTVVHVCIPVRISIELRLSNWSPQLAVYTSICFVSSSAFVLLLTTLPLDFAPPAHTKHADGLTLAFEDENHDGNRNVQTKILILGTREPVLIVRLSFIPMNVWLV